MRVWIDSDLSRRLIVLVGFVTGVSQCLNAQWTWMGGSDTVGSQGYQPGVYGKLGVPSAVNVPSSRTAPAAWTGSQGNLWMFGGFLFNYASKFIWLNDFWEYNPSTNEWTWVSGGDTSAPCFDYLGATYCGYRGNYGQLGKASAKNAPGSRESAQFWTDKKGNLWLFGGLGFDGKGNWGALNDVWKFDTGTREWTWMGGDSVVPSDGSGAGGVYGSLGKPSPENNPGALFWGSVWTDKNGDAWVFGGMGYDEHDLNGQPNNLYQFYPATNEWAWMEGSRTFDYPWIHGSVYGKKGAAAAGNIPGSRWTASSWTDRNGSFWLFGGSGYDAEQNSGYLDELWMFNPVSKEWTWMGGYQTLSCAPNSDKQNCGRVGVYGNLGEPSASNLPGGRTVAQTWTGTDGRLWLFGGQGYRANVVDFLDLNDLWEFNSATHVWTWRGGGPAMPSGMGVYGVRGVPSSENNPGGRAAAATWVDKEGNLWMFGGGGLDGSGQGGELNDMWRYQPNR